MKWWEGGLKRWTQAEIRDLPVGQLLIAVLLLKLRSQVWEERSAPPPLVQYELQKREEEAGVGAISDTPVAPISPMLASHLHLRQHASLDRPAYQVRTEAVVQFCSHAKSCKACTHLNNLRLASLECICLIA